MPSRPTTASRSAGSRGERGRTAAPCRCASRGRRGRGCSGRGWGGPEFWLWRYVLPPFLDIEIEEVECEMAPCVRRRVEEAKEETAEARARRGRGARRARSGGAGGGRRRCVEPVGVGADDRDAGALQRAPDAGVVAELLHDLPREAAVDEVGEVGARLGRFRRRGALRSPEPRHVGSEERGHVRLVQVERADRQWVTNARSRAGSAVPSPALSATSWRARRRLKA